MQFAAVLPLRVPFRHNHECGYESDRRANNNRRTTVKFQERDSEKEKGQVRPISGPCGRDFIVRCERTSHNNKKELCSP